MPKITNGKNIKTCFLYFLNKIKRNNKIVTIKTYGKASPTREITNIDLGEIYGDKKETINKKRVK